MTQPQALGTRIFDPELKGYRYPRAVKFFEFRDQAKGLRMAHMDAELECANGARAVPIADAL